MTFLRIRNLLSSLKRLNSTKANAAENEILLPSLASKVTKDNQDTVLSDVITPLWKYDYREQILSKKKWIKGVLNDVKSKHLPEVNTTLHRIIPSVKLTEYRNREVLNISSGVDGNEKTVGFFVGSKANDVVCVFPRNLMSMKAVHVEVAQVFQDYIRTSSLATCHELNDGGFWRGITVTSNRDGNVLAIINAHPSGAKETDLKMIKDSIANCFRERLPSVESLYLQLCPHSKCTHTQAPYMLVGGKECIFENIGKYIFRISPESFLPMNVETVPLLFDSILDLVNVDGSYTLIDINCGSGAFSIYASSYVRGCVGIDKSTLAVENATLNVKNNAVHNCNFLQGSIEEVLKRVFNDLESTLKVVAVVHAGRSGISRDLIRILRRFVPLKKLVYISSKADSATPLRSFIDMCHPRFDLSHPFSLTDILPVDMSPHTRYCELVMLFKRK